ncbi:MAG: ABC transporter substrate-binding protein [Chloroflexi bacterium]|nr:ABC transporter substrate-binding protein [Chloroflexota bacterium]
MIGCDDDDDDDDSASAAPAAPAATGGSSPAPSTSAPEPAKEITVRFAANNPIPTMSPNSTAASTSELHAIYDGLTRQVAQPGGGATIDAGLAESWESPDGGGRTWVFKLREAEWSDGTPFTAEDVAWVHDFYKNPESQSRLISRVGTYESSKVLDDRTIEITTASDPIFPKREGIVFILPKHIFTDASINPEEFMGSTPVGTGAYVVDDFKQGQVVNMLKSPSGYRAGDIGGVTKINYNWIGETSTRMAAVEAGDIDFAQQVPTTDAERIRGINNIEVVNAPPTTNQAWDFANKPGDDPGITNDPRVRQALNYGLDREGIIIAAYDGQTRAARDQLITPDVFGHQSDWPVIAYDPDKARALLADAGFANGASMNIDAQILISPTLKPILEASIGLWEEIGVKSDVRTIEVNVWRDRLYGRATEGRPGAFLMGWSSFLYEAALALQWHESSNPYDLWANPKFDELFEAVNKEVDGEARSKLYRLLMQEERVESGGELVSGPSAFIAENPTIQAFRSDVIEPSSLNPWTTPELRFENVVPA